MFENTLSSQMFLPYSPSVKPSFSQPAKGEQCYQNDEQPTDPGLPEALMEQEHLKTINEYYTYPSSTYQCFVFVGRAFFLSLK